MHFEMLSLQAPSIDEVGSSIPSMDIVGGIRGLIYALY